MMILTHTKITSDGSTRMRFVVCAYDNLGGSVHLIVDTSSTEASCTDTPSGSTTGRIRSPSAPTASPAPGETIGIDPDTCMKCLAVTRTVWNKDRTRWECAKCSSKKLA